MTDTPSTLLDAVDALTTPVVLARFTGTDHDHEWLDLVRPTTREERVEAKKAKRKLGRTLKTGEFWCPWCDSAVTERPDHEPERRISRRDEPPLLEQLQDRIRTTLGDSGTRGANTGGSPIDISAFDKAREIDRDVRYWIEQLGGRPGADLTLTQLVRSWYLLRIGGVTPVGEDDRYRIILEKWATTVRDILDPPEQIPYRGQACPLCGETSAVKTVEGDADDAVALWAFLRPAYREEGSYGMCKACNRVLATDPDPLALRRIMNGTVQTGKVGLLYSTESGLDERMTS